MDLGNKIKSGLKWSAISKFLSQLITWGLTIYVMRLLDPEDYGLMAMAMIFIGFLYLIKEFGLGPAIVQNKNLNQHILKQIFGILIIVNIVLLGLVYVIAPSIANFFEQPLLVDILRVLSLMFLLMPFESIPNALLQRDLKFKQLAAVEFVSAVAGGIITFTLAWNGFGIWSLIYGALCLDVVRTVMLNIFCFWLQFPKFNFKGLGEHISFGGLVTADQVLWFFYSQADAFIVGKLLGPQILGFYSVAIHLSSLPMQKLNSVINQVAFPAFSQIQEDKKQVTYYTNKSIRLLSFIAFPIFFGISSIAEDGVLLVLGDKWESAILPIMILCVIMPIRMISNIFPSVVRGCGRADISVINLLFACVIMPVSFYIGASWGLEGVSYAWIIAYPVVFFIEVTRSKVVTGVSFYDILKIISVPLLLSIIMLTVIWFCKVNLAIESHGLALITQILIGILVYAPLIFLFRRDEVDEVISFIKP